MANIETIEQLAKRRGFFYPSDEIYGGLSGFYTYGHIGTLMKRKLETIWRRFFLKEDNFFEIEPSDMMHEKVFEASGHLTSFVDPVVKCSKCKTVHRADHIVEEYLGRSFEGMSPEELAELIENHKIVCPKCKGKLADISVLNLMFPVSIGQQDKAYLRPETAQGVYVNFLRQFELQRKKLPLGLAIIGKAFRNEISPRQLVTRMREFTQAELQIFFDPHKIDEHEDWNSVKKYSLILKPASGKDEIKEMTCEKIVKDLKLPVFYVYYMAKVQKFFFEVLQIPKKKFRFRELSEDEKAFYNKLHWDIELDLESLGGFKEMGGCHYRTDHDLLGHEKISKQPQEVFFDEKKIKPHVLELSFGIDRILLALLDLFYIKEKDRTILKLPVNISPLTAAVFPLVNKDKIDDKAKEIFDDLKNYLDVIYDDSGSIGRRYARADEIGTPFAITIDYDTLKDFQVTIRNRDTTEQQRVKINDIVRFICKELGKNLFII
jgi:glycyl-tRNA synthetase